MKLPSEREINPHLGCLDGEYAVKMFFGKTLEEAEVLFQENGLSRREDLMYMGPVAFVFYFTAALRYLKSPMSADDSDFASSMTDLLEWRVLGEHEDYQQIRSARSDMIEFCSHLMKHYDLYDINFHIYGDLRPRLDKLLKKLQEGEAAPSNGG